MKVSIPAVQIVDDSLANLRVLSQLIEEMGYEARISTNGEAALQSIHEAPPDLILMDVNMPGIDGYETVRRLKLDPALRDIPVIFVSALNQEFNKTQAFQCGAVDYITKPIQFAEAKARIQTHLKLAQQRQELLQKEQDLGELLQMISHDLANPIGTIAMAADILRRQPGLTADSRLELIIKAAGLSCDLIRSVRDYRRAEVKEIKLTPVDLNDSMESSLAVLSEKMISKHIRVETQFSPGLKVLAEKESLILTVICNLISNAVKFSPPASVIRLRTWKDGACAYFCVKDCGVGIPASELPHLFDTRKSASRLGTCGERGTGFGLPLTHRYVQAFGGHIHVDTVDAGDDHGTAFIVRLPLA